MEIPADCALWRASLAASGPEGERSVENFDRDHDLDDPRPQSAFFKAVAGVDWDRAGSALHETIERINGAGTLLQGRPCAGRRELVRLIRASSLRHALGDVLLGKLLDAVKRPFDSIEFLPAAAFAQFDAVFQALLRESPKEEKVLRITSASSTVFASFPEALASATAAASSTHELAAMLGIGWPRTPNCYLVRYSLPEGQGPMKPTAFDGCGQRYFRAWGDDAPHGFTEDLRVTEATPTRGLPEVVHGPVLLDEGWVMARMPPRFMELDQP